MKCDQNKGQRAMFKTFLTIGNIESFPECSEISLENNHQKINFKFPDSQNFLRSYEKKTENQKLLKSE